MKSLAEFIMRGPVQGALVATAAMASLFLAWLGAAAVALIVLRHGFNRAAPVFLAALLPAAFWMYSGDIGPLTTLLCAVALAGVLRFSRSWSSTLLATPFVVGAWCLLIVLALPEYVETIRAIFEQVVEGIKQRLSESGGEANVQALESMGAPSGLQIMGMLALLQALTTMFSVVVARWWQALLYNPGGFREEFHLMRLQRLHALLLVAGFVVLVAVPDYSFWAWLFIAPLLLAGLALVHGIAHIMGWPVRWLVVFYLLVFFILRPLLALVAACAVADSALDFRSRLAAARKS